MHYCLLVVWQCVGAIMASPTPKWIKPDPKPNNEPLVKAILLAPTIQNDQEKPRLTSVEKTTADDPSQIIDHMIKELKFDLKCPLKDALNSVFNRDGQVILAFPGSSCIQVSIKRVS